jgi:chloramphenicol-sensitive protein RarD
VTAVPLVCFGEATRRLPLTTLGFLQYLAPSLQLALAVLLFKEHFGVEHAVSFGLIWVGLAVFTVESMVARRRQEPAPLPIPVSMPASGE